MVRPGGETLHIAVVSRIAVVCFAVMGYGSGDHVNTCRGAAVVATGRARRRRRAGELTDRLTGHALMKF